MSLKITPQQCSSEEEATAILQGMGYYTLPFDIPPAQNELHWHDFDATFFIVSGDFAVACEGEAEFRSAGPGDRVDAPRGVIHRERHNGYRAVFGWPVDPSTLTMPLEREPPVPPPH